MIRSEQEYQECLRRLEQDRQHIAQQKTALKKAGLSGKQIEKALEPTLSFHQQLLEEIEWYEKIKRRGFGEMRKITDIGRILIALRIANNLSQQELADRLGVTAPQVSRDERNEYHGITLARAQRVLDALEEEVVSRVRDKPSGPGKMAAVG